MRGPGPSQFHRPRSGEPLAARRPGPGPRTSRGSDLISDLRACPIPELARPDRTLQAWGVELGAHVGHPAISNGPTENLNLTIKNLKRIARGTANSATSDCDYCSTTAASARDRSPNRDQNPLSQGALRRAAQLAPWLPTGASCYQTVAGVGRPQALLRTQRVDNRTPALVSLDSLDCPPGFVRTTHLDISAACTIPPACRHDRPP
jgi:Transposase